MKSLMLKEYVCEVSETFIYKKSPKPPQSRKIVNKWYSGESTISEISR